MVDNIPNLKIFLKLAAPVKVNVKETGALLLILSSTL